MTDTDIARTLQLVLDGQAAQRDETAAGFKRLSADVALVASELDVVKGRVGVVEERQNDTDAWRRSNSDRVRGLANATSNADLAHESRLAAEIVARESLASEMRALSAETADQTRMLARLEKLAANPIVKQIATAVGAGILAYLASKGLR